MTGIMPYNYMTELDFKSVYVDATHILATPYGASMYPILVNPSIMLYNKKILSENGFAYPPKYWTDLPKYQEKLTFLDSENKPKQSAFGMSANNIVNQKHILYTQLLQLGINPVKYLNGNVFADVGMGQTTFDDPTPNLIKMLRFQASFSDPQKTSFTWSETDISDIDKFISGNLAIYFAKASDINYISEKNPTLEMGMYFMPQMQDAAFQAVSGEMTGIAMGRFTKDMPYAIETAQVFSGADFSRSLSFATGQAGARRDVLYGTDGSERAEVVGRSTLITKIIYDNNYQQVNNLMYTLYENILSGRKTIDAAAEKFSTDWISLFSAR
jgi:ABC-type glycerol-3-phosphate transport system substrate-binding protein